MKTTLRLGFMFVALLSVPVVVAQNAEADSIKDTRDGQFYEIVKIGSYWWLAENLNFNAGSGSWCYDDNAEACKVFGRLYDWETATEACPAGWHLPDDKEWQDLEKALGMSDYYLDQMGWRNFEKDLLYEEDQGMKIIMAGYRPFGDGSFDDIKDDAYYWTSTSYDRSNAWKRSLDDNRMQIGRGYDSKLQGFSVRCVKD